MRYGISIHNRKGFRRRFPYLTFWWGNFALVFFLYSARGWFKTIRYNMNYNHPPDHYGLDGWFIGVQNSKEYPVYKDED